MQVATIESASLAAAFVVQAVLARLLGAAAFGDYSYALAWVLALALVGKAGAEASSLRFVASYGALGEWPLLVGFVRSTLARTAALSTLLALGAALVTFAAPGMARPLRLVFWVACSLVPVEALVEVTVAILKALGRAPAAVAVAGIGRRALQLVLLAALAWPRGEPGATLAVALHLASGLLALALLALLLARGLPRAAQGALPSYDRGTWRRTGGVLFGFGVVLATISRLDSLLLGLLRGTSEVGIYAVASRLAGLAVFGQAALNSILAPEISRLWSRGETAELERTAKRASRLASAFALAAALGLVALGKPVLRIFGPEFTAGYLPLLVLLAGNVVNAFSGSVGYLMNMTGHQGDALRWAAAVLGLGLALHVVLIPHFGALGAAIATAVATALWNLFLVRRVKETLGIDPTALAGSRRP
jgi:O-antigen/teichoic acid export membrane protein